MDARTKILNAASELFLEGGGDALSVRAISKRAGLSTIGIYSHFQGKQGILDALYIEGFNHVREAMVPGVRHQLEAGLVEVVGITLNGDASESVRADLAGAT